MPVTAVKPAGIHATAESFSCRPAAQEAVVGGALEPTADPPDSAREKVLVPGSLVGRTLGESGPVLQQALLEVLPLCSQSTGRVCSRSVFPLPTSSNVLTAIFPDLSVYEISWMLCVTMALNSLWGNELLSDRMPNTVQTSCLEGLVTDVKRFCSLPGMIDAVDWKHFFQVRSIDYKGDEVQVARWFSWSNIEPALPPEIGRVPLEEVCSQGCKHYVENFDFYLKPKSEWPKLTKPRVMVLDDEWDDVCRGLVRTGVCCFMEEDDIFHTEAGPLLNGLFGVTKDDFTKDGCEIFRLIMNLVPLNNLCRAHTFCNPLSLSSSAVRM